MSLQLSHLVTCGELYNTRGYCVFGRLGLRGFEQALMLELTGNPEADLRGRVLRFEIRDQAEEQIDDESESQNDRLERLHLKGLAWQQIGPTGVITAARKVRVADGPPGESADHTKLDDPAAITWKRCLHLEWFSQNGRVIVQLVDPVIEILDPDDPRLKEDAEQDAGQAPSEFVGAHSPIHTDSDCDDERRNDALSSDEFDDPEEGDDPYGLMPDGLQRQLNREARDVDLAMGGDSEKSEVIRELELMDDLMETSEGEPLCGLFDEVIKAPLPDSVDDEQAERALKSLLAELALYGIALDVCDHFTPRHTYKLLIEQIMREESAYRELRGTQWVQHYATSDYCAECDAEFEREWKASDSDPGGPGP